MVFQVELRWYFRWWCDDKIVMILPFPLKMRAFNVDEIVG
jgi:hypothetical protein